MKTVLPAKKSAIVMDERAGCIEAIGVLMQKSNEGIYVEFTVSSLHLIPIVV